MNLTGQTVQPKPAKLKADPAYIARVKGLPCVCCGAIGVDAHHCRDMPAHAEQGLYTRLPGAAQRSGDRDAIPLCPFHHDLFHRHRGEFHALYGKDYTYIAPTRAALSKMELDF